MILNKKNIITNEFNKNFMSIVIVNYNTGKLLLNCVTSIMHYLLRNFEIVVIDNGSTDDSIGIIEDLTIKNNNLKIIKTNNVGFSAGNNLGVRHSNGNIIYFLNPDTIVDVSINEIYDSVINAEESCIWVTGLKNEDGTPQKSKYPCLTLKNYINYVFGFNQISYWYLGASIIMSRKLYSELGGWSEDYFLYAEDMDLFHKAMIKKIKTIELPYMVTHIGGVSTTNVWGVTQRNIVVERAGLIFAKKFKLGDKYYLLWFLGNIKIGLKNPAIFFSRLVCLIKAHDRFR
jgi:hypothetical protein